MWVSPTNARPKSSSPDSGWSRPQPSFQPLFAAPVKPLRGSRVQPRGFPHTQRFCQRGYLGWVRASYYSRSRHISPLPPVCSNVPCHGAARNSMCSIPYFGTPSVLASRISPHGQTSLETQAIQVLPIYIYRFEYTYLRTFKYYKFIDKAHSVKRGHRTIPQERFQVRPGVSRKY